MRLVLLAALGLGLQACTPAPAPEAEAPVAPAAEEMAAAPEVTPALPEMPMTGGYAPASLEDERVKAAQAVAVAEITKREGAAPMIDSVEAQQQVVAGMNYSFTIKAAGGATYSVTVFHSLEDKLEVTDYAKVG